MAKKKSKGDIPRPSDNFKLIKAIRGEKQKNSDGERFLYKSNVKVRNTKAHKFILENVERKTVRSIMPGQLIMFKYLRPITKDQLKYYDAWPCTFFLGEVDTDNGTRVIGFNIHYYPPRVRFLVMDRLWDIFGPQLLDTWDEPFKRQMRNVNYKLIIKQIEKAKLDFGVREYAPELMKDIRPIPPKYWQKAVFTEGVFQKETRDQILSYWKNKEIDVDAR